jgi:hypothetical protein
MVVLRSLFEHMRRKGVAQGMATGGFGDPSLADRRFDSPLQHQRRYMMPPFDATAGVDRTAGGWKDVLPDPLTRGLRVFPLQGIW